MTTSTIPAGYSFSDTLDREVARCISLGYITRELRAAAHRAGALYDDVADHIAAEILNNR